MVAAWADRAIDLCLLENLDVGPDVWRSGSLDAFFALGPDAWAATRAQLQDRLTASDLPDAAVRPRSEVRPQVPFTVADYVDFYASEAHATHMGQLLRPGSAPLPPAWRHLPMGYHGRAGTVVVSGTPITRPSGLTQPGVYGPSQRLDVEVELGFVIGRGSPLGRPVAADEAERHVFGVVLVNDWSARDIQAFEYQPLGPLLGKSFATSISPWVTPLAALAPFRVDGPAQDPPPAPHLRAPEPRAVDIHLELDLCGTVISRTSAAGLYWSIAQQVAHLTSNGAALRPGDLLASGTVSDWEAGTEGSLMELARAGSAPITLDDGSQRTWLQDGDTVVIRAWCGGRDGPNRLSLGEVSGTIVPRPGCAEEA